MIDGNFIAVKSSEIQTKNHSSTLILSVIK